MVVQVKIKFKSSWGLSHYFEGWRREICCLAWPFAFVLGNESPSRGGRAGLLPISLCFNYPACLQQGNEVGVTAGVKRQPVTAASPLGLSFPWWWSVDWQGQGGGGERPTTERALTRTLSEKPAHIHRTDLQLPYVFIRVRATKAGITFERPVNKVGIDLISCVIRFAVWHQVQQ